MGIRIFLHQDTGLTAPEAMLACSSPWKMASDGCCSWLMSRGRCRKARPSGAENTHHPPSLAGCSGWSEVGRSPWRIAPAGRNSLLMVPRHCCLADSADLMRGSWGWTAHFSPPGATHILGTSSSRRHCVYITAPIATGTALAAILLCINGASGSTPAHAKGNARLPPA